MKTLWREYLREVCLALAISSELVSTPCGAGGLVAGWGGSYDQSPVPAGLVNVKAVAGGADGSLALKADGSLVLWGTLAGPSMISTASGFKAVAAGASHYLALQNNGAVLSWGLTNASVQPVAGLSNVISLATWGTNSLVVKADGTVWTWDTATGIILKPSAAPDNVIAVAAGPSHSLALRGDGTVVGWGDNTYGQATVPTGLSNVVAIVAGGFFSLALQADGTVIGWGDNAAGQTTIPAGLSNVIAIAAGSSHSLALRTDGTVVAWGDNSQGQATVPSGLSHVRGIAAGLNHSLALVDDGPVQILQSPASQMALWGTNTSLTVIASGQPPASYSWYLNGTLVTNGVYASSEGKGVYGISGADTATLALSNAPFARGGAYTVVVSNALGAMRSEAALLTVYSPPVVLSQPAGATLGAGNNFTCSAVVTGSTPLYYQWLLNSSPLAGANQSVLSLNNVQPSQSGDYALQVSNVYGITLSAPATLVVTDNPPFIAKQPLSQTVVVGGKCSFSVDARGSLPLSYQWRFNGNDIPGATNASLALSNLTADQTGYYSVLIANPLGQISSAKAQLAVVRVYVSSTDTRYAPTNVPVTATNLVALAAGRGFLLGLRADGTVTGWANSVYGSEVRYQTNVPAGLSNAASIVVGSTFCMALRSNGTVAAWGQSGTLISQTNVLTNIMAVAAGANNGIALRSNGTVYVWGLTTYGQTNIPRDLVNVIGVAVGDSHCLALRADGRVVSWGYNGYGQTNVPAGLSNVIAVQACANGSMAIRRDGTVVAWGSAPSVGSTNLSNVVSLAAFGTQGLALLKDGTVQAFGAKAGSKDFDSSLTNLSNISSIAMGGVQLPFFAALIGDGSPSVTIPPASQTATPGARVTLCCRAAGVQPMSFQWQRNGASLPGATSDTLVLDTVSAQDAGSYRVLVSNARGITISPAANLALSQILVWQPVKQSGYGVPTNIPPGLLDLVDLAPGDTHIIGLRANGSAICWANPTNGLVTNQPASLTNIIGLAALGSTQNLFLRTSGTVTVCGTSGITANVPAGLSNIVAVAANADEMALRADGTVIAWNPFAPTNAYSVPALSNLVAISSGNTRSLALDRLGNVFCWTNNSSTLAFVPSQATNVIAVAAGYSHFLALRANGTVVSWGAASNVIVNNVFAGLTNVVAIAAGYNQSMALKADGSILVSNSLSSSADYSTPGPMANVIKIALGRSPANPYAVVLMGNGSPALVLQPADQAVNLGDTVQLHARAAGALPVQYQWQLNGANLPDATNSTLVINGVQPRDVGVYRAIVSNGQGSQVSRSATVSIPLTLPGALNTTNLVWSGSGMAPWFAQTAVSHDGFAAARSGAITDSQSSVLQTAVTGPGTLSFWWKVSSEEDFDYLTFTVNGTAPVPAISGESGWEQVTLHLSSATNTLRWTYAKDESVSDGLDAAWVDEVSFTPDLPAILASPQSQTVMAGASVTLSVSATGQTACQWLKDGAELAGSTGTVLQLSNVCRSQGGTYLARVSNAGGAVLSSNAQLTVRVPQALSAPIRLPDGSFAFTSRDADGASLQAVDPARFSVQATTDLVHWQTLTNGLTLSNGALHLLDPSASNTPCRFYRLVERQP
jgi:alpha-tubulin suppressor-like RCC1 family protein